MLNTKVIIRILITVFALFPGCKATGQISNSELTLVVINKGSYSLAECDSSCFFLFEAQLINNSETPIEFVAYSCLTCFNFLTNNSKVQIYGNHCSSNSASPFIIDPNKKLSIPLILKAKQNACINIDSIRIGFIFLPPRDLKDKRFRDIITEMKINKRNTLWSEPVPFHLCVDRQYVITDK
jgi:hypothetical protein